MSAFLNQIITTALILTFALPASAQQPAPLSEQEQTVKLKADHLSLKAKISVVRLYKDEEFGTFISNNAEEFTFYDVDRKAEVTLKYAEVKRIKEGYGGYNSVAGRHVDRRRNLIVVALVVAGLAVLIGAAAAAK